jgi:glycosyltransferase involved in cell wall biosynthesis
VTITLITVVYNRAATIERTILSVLEQSYPHIEYIVVDGASTDGTLSIIQQYSQRIDTLISEKDNGVYDAINKGIMAATGDIVGVLHADDCFTHNDVIKNDFEAQNEPKDFPWGNTEFTITDPDGHKLTYTSPIEKV